MFLTDLRAAAKTLARAPGFTVVTVLTPAVRASRLDPTVALRRG